MYDDIKLIYPEKELGKAEDLSNVRFGEWIALYRTNNDKFNKTMWVCKCSCINSTIKPVSTKSLKAGVSTNCGCIRLETISNNSDKKIHIRNSKNEIVKKKCFRCNRLLPLENFYHNRNQKDGYNNECKQCENESKESRYNTYKKNAIKRKIKFNISKQEFYDITSKPCYFCDGYSKYDMNNIPYNGIDRIDSFKNYDTNNIVPCCEMCNKMKMNYNVDLFLCHIEKISKYQEVKNNE